jgi:hypothetical protein
MYLDKFGKHVPGSWSLSVPPADSPKNSRVKELLARAARLAEAA